MISQSNSYFKGRQKEMEYKVKRLLFSIMKSPKCVPLLNMVYPNIDSAAIFSQLLSRFSRFHLLK